MKRFVALTLVLLTVASISFSQQPRQARKQQPANRTQVDKAEKKGIKRSFTINDIEVKAQKRTNGTVMVGFRLKDSSLCIRAKFLVNAICEKNSRKEYKFEKIIEAKQGEKYTWVLVSAIKASEFKGEDAYSIRMEEGGVFQKWEKHGCPHCGTTRTDPDTWYLGEETYPNLWIRYFYKCKKCKTLFCTD